MYSIYQWELFFAKMQSLSVREVCFLSDGTLNIDLIDVSCSCCARGYDPCATCVKFRIFDIDAAKLASIYSSIFELQPDLPDDFFHVVS